VSQVVINRSQGHSLNLVVENAAVVERLRNQLEAAQVPVFALAQSRASLDDVYLQATGRTLMNGLFPEFNGEEKSVASVIAAADQPLVAEALRAITERAEGSR
jgi:CTP:molybdopterin cytidylyltransferase MocA